MGLNSVPGDLSKCKRLFGACCRFSFRFACGFLSFLLGSFWNLFALFWPFGVLVDFLASLLVSTGFSSFWFSSWGFYYCLPVGFLLVQLLCYLRFCFPNSFNQFGPLWLGPTGVAFDFLDLRTGLAKNLQHCLPNGLKRNERVQEVTLRATEHATTLMDPKIRKTWFIADFLIARSPRTRLHRQIRSFGRGGTSTFVCGWYAIAYLFLGQPEQKIVKATRKSPNIETDLKHGTAANTQTLHPMMSRALA